MKSWFTAVPLDLLGTVVSAILIFAVLISLVRLVGLRSFSKMTGVDFAMTIAVGSILASCVLSPSPSLLSASVALATLFAIQWAVARLRRNTSWMTRLTDNQPVLLMIGLQILTENMKRCRVTEDDLWAKLREANVLNPSQVRAVVLETTGDISVLHGEADAQELHPCLLRGVQGTEQVDLGPDNFQS